MNLGTPDFINFMKKNQAISEAKPTEIRKMRGQQLTFKELILTGFDRPILVETTNGLEISLESDFNFETISKYYAGGNLIDAIEVTRQIKIKHQFAYLLAQFELDKDDRRDVYSFRINMSKDSFKHENFHPPRIVQRLSWIDMYWPDVAFKPRLSRYCFCSMQNAYNDFHIDIGGASAWFHLIEGEQIFYLIEPNENNLASFEKWIQSDNLHEIMFCKNVETLFKIKISKGQTIFIPNGWIYSVLSLQDTLAFGGYFFHSLNIAKQISINDFLRSLKKPELDFQSFELINWYAAPNILKLAKESLKNQPPKHLSKGIEVLIEKLRLWLHKSKSKRNDNQMLTPKAINCAKIIRDLSRCQKKKKKLSKDLILKTKIKERKSSLTELDPIREEKTTTELPFNPEEAKIKDLVETGESNNLKLKFNMKLAQNVIRKSLDDPYSLDDDEQEMKLLESKSHLIKTKTKRKHPENKALSGDVSSKQKQSDYYYMDIASLEGQRHRKDHDGTEEDDETWEPVKDKNRQKKSTSNNNKSINHSQSKKNEKQSNFSSMSYSTHRSGVGNNDDDNNNNNTSNINNNNEKISSSSSALSAAKKYKKGQATPKQRLAKKLKMSR
ncbi:hypothetical protein NH340_JMT01662 [Sarcoptes scabiei]|nr:hypothetical protein NH340_JMT01662 [Sarcoptes scabiei]